MGEFDDVVKTGRTHLMDATPIRLSQEIGGWAYQVAQSIERIESCLPRLGRLALGGTAVGTGLNAHPEFGARVAARLAGHTGLPLLESEHHFAAQSAMDTATELSGHLKTTASALMKIANDLRWMNSGPHGSLWAGWFGRTIYHKRIPTNIEGVFVTVTYDDGQPRRRKVNSRAKRREGKS